MARGLTVVDTKTGGLSFIPGTYMLEGGDSHKQPCDLHT